MLKYHGHKTQEMDRFSGTPVWLRQATLAPFGSVSSTWVDSSHRVLLVVTGSRTITVLHCPPRHLHFGKGEKKLNIYTLQSIKVAWSSRLHGCDPWTAAGAQVHLCSSSFFQLLPQPIWRLPPHRRLTPLAPCLGSSRVAKMCNMDRWARNTS